MELPPGQQKMLFAVVVVVLVGLGIYLTTGRGQTTAVTSASSPSPAVGRPSGTAASTAVPPATVPPPAPIPTVAGGADIYEWLPFTQADLTTAAKTTLAFAVSYATWSYTDSKAAYAARLAPLVTPQEAATLEYDYGTAGVAGARTAGKQVSTGTASITSISSFGASPASITFQVPIAQRLASTTGTTDSTSRYAITVVSSGGGWRVNNIELSTQGNQ